MKQLFLFNLIMLLKQLREVHLPLQSLFNECQFYHLYVPWGCSDFSTFSCRWEETWRKKLVGNSSNRESFFTSHLEKQNRRVWDVSPKAEPLWLLRDRVFMLKEGRVSMKHEIQGNWSCFTISPTLDLTIQVIGMVNYASQTYLTADHLINVSSSFHFHLQDQKSAGPVWGMVF